MQLRINHALPSSLTADYGEDLSTQKAGVDDTYTLLMSVGRATAANDIYLLDLEQSYFPPCV